MTVLLSFFEKRNQAFTSSAPPSAMIKLKPTRCTSIRVPFFFFSEMGVYELIGDTNYYGKLFMTSVIKPKGNFVFKGEPFCSSLHFISGRLFKRKQIL